MKTRILSLLISCCIAASFASCASKDNSRAISTPPASVVEPGGTPAPNLPADPVVVNAERVINVSNHTLNLIVTLEHDNRAAFAKASPAIHPFVENIRRNGLGWIRKANYLKNVYKDNRNSDNRANLLTALATVSNAADTAKNYLAAAGFGTNP